MEMEGDDRTFRVSFSTEGVSMLSEHVEEKLKEFMGDYTDDTLVEYVIVLLKNGRSKDEAKSELDVFLGDDSGSFVSWLWDHLGSNISLYAQPQDTHPDVAWKTKSTARGQAEKAGTLQVESDSGKMNLNQRDEMLVSNGEGTKSSIARKTLMDNDNSQDKPDRRVVCTKSAHSPSQTIQKKRRRSDEQHPKKRVVLQSTVTAPRRLLQFAVRDAVTPSRPPSTTAEHPPKRLRSLISTSTVDTPLEERCHRMPRISMFAVIKALSEAVKDVTKDRSSSSVIDRLGITTDVSVACCDEENEIVADDISGEDVNMEMENFQPAYRWQNDIGMPQERNLSSLDSLHDNFVDTNLGYGAEDYDDSGGWGREVENTRWSRTSAGNWVDNSETLQCYVGDNANENRVQKQHKYLGLPETMPNTSLRISSSTIMNTRQHPRHQEEREAPEMDDQNTTEGSDDMAAKSDLWLMEENDNATLDIKDMAKMGTIPQQSQKHQMSTGLHNISPPTEHADSRTIFVSNVHFAATKDGLWRHFNKFGEVLTVIILTDPTTGRSKGSAYIEFLRKDAAKLALSLDGTSFMSRILKIVMKSCAQPKAAASITTWPHIALAPQFSVPLFGRVPFGRVTPPLYRGQPNFKFGARSLQWKRDADSTAAGPSGHRSFTYVRLEQPKANGGSGTG